MANNFSDAFAAWLFASEALTADSIGTNTLTAHGSPTSGTPVQGCASAHLVAASNQYFSITDALLAAGFPFKSGDTGRIISVCAKFRANASNWTPIVGKLQFYSAGCWGIGWDQSLTPLFEYDGSYSRPQPGITNGHEYQVIYTIDGINKLVTIYMYDYTSGTVITSCSFYVPGSTLSGSSLPLLFGYEPYFGAYANMDLAEVVVFNRLLNSAEMEQIRQQVYAGTYNPAVPSLSSPDLYDDFEGGNLNKWSPNSGSIISGMTTHCWAGGGTTDEITHLFTATPMIVGKIDFLNNGGIGTGIYDLISFYSGSTQLFIIRRDFIKWNIQIKGIYNNIIFGAGSTYLPADSIIRTLYFEITPGDPGRIKVWLNSVLQVDFQGNLSGTYNTVSKIVIGSSSSFYSRVNIDNVYFRTAPPPQTISPTSIPSEEAFGTPTLIVGPSPCRSLTTCEDVVAAPEDCRSLTTCTTIGGEPPANCRSLTTCSELGLNSPDSVRSLTSVQDVPLSNGGLFLVF